MEDYKNYLADQVLSEDKIVRRTLLLPSSQQMLTFSGHIPNSEPSSKRQRQCRQAVSA